MLKTNTIKGIKEDVLPHKQRFERGEIEIKGGKMRAKKEFKLNEAISRGWLNHSGLYDAESRYSAGCRIASIHHAALLSHGSGICLDRVSSSGWKGFSDKKLDAIDELGCVMSAMPEVSREMIWYTCCEGHIFSEFTAIRRYAMYGGKGFASARLCEALDDLCVVFKKRKFGGLTSRSTP